MTAVRARIGDRFEMDGIAVIFDRRLDGGLFEVWPPGGDHQVFSPDGTVDQGPPPMRLTNDEARALLQALQRWYGGDVDDTRALRKDYDAERARVDKLVDVVAAIAKAQAT